MAQARTSRVSGLVEMVILRCLAEREMYGYELVQAVHERTNGEIELREGLLYPLLNHLTVAGRLKRRREVVDGRPRVYYRLTPKGRVHFEALREEWGRMVRAVRQVLA